MLRHDPRIFGGPALFHLGQFRLANHIVEALPELARDAARLADPIADDAHRLWQVLRPDHDKRHDRDQQELARIDVEHGRRRLSGDADQRCSSRMRLPSRSNAGSAVFCASMRAAGLAAASSSSAMPFLKFFTPLATSPIRFENRPATEQQDRDDGEDEQMDRAEAAHGISPRMPNYLVALIVLCHLQSFLQCKIDGVEQPAARRSSMPGRSRRLESPKCARKPGVVANISGRPAPRGDPRGAPSPPPSARRACPWRSVRRGSLRSRRA